MGESITGPPAMEGSFYEDNKSIVSILYVSCELKK
jgi:hypothetical protein